MGPPGQTSTGTLFSRLYRFLLRPSEVGALLAGESLAVTILRFLLVTLVLWAWVILVFVVGSMPNSASPASFPEQWWESATRIFGSHPVLLLGLNYAGTLGGSLTFCFLSTWFSFVESYRSGPILRAFGRALRVAMAGLWIAALLAILCTLLFWSVDALRPPGSSFQRDVSIACTLLSAVLCFAALVHWFARAMRSIPADSPSLTPLCEGCGYDLSHEPVGGVCPECGLALASSLEAGKRRVGSAWETRPGVLAWLKSCAEVIFRPSRFYGRLRLRGAQPSARRFAVFYYLLMIPCAADWVFAIMVRVIRSPPPEDEGGWWLAAFVVLVITGAVVLAGWGIKRLVAAMVTTVWFLRRELPDGRWAAKVVAYETTYLGVFCAFNGLLFTSFAISSRWVQRLEELIFGHRIYVFGVPPDALLLWLGNLGLIGLWLLRYRTILRAIRWSNF